MLRSVDMGVDEKLVNFNSLVSKLKGLDLDDNEKSLINDYLKMGRESMLFLDEEILSNISAWARKETDTVKRDIQSNIRLYRRTMGKNVGNKLFLIRFLKSKDPDVKFPKQPYINLG